LGEKRDDLAQGEQMGKLAGKVAVITGGASGIGRAAALAFYAEGAVVGVLDRDQRRVDAIVGELGPSAFGLAADVSNEVSVEAAFAKVRSRASRLDVLYNCAAIQLHGRDARAHELSMDVWSQTIAVNLTGVFLSCKHAIPLMLEAGGGSIINCASPTGMRGSAVGYDAYSTSKGGVMALTRVMAMDYAGDGIRVNSIVPGAVDSPLIEEILSDEPTRQGLVANIPLGRISTPEEYTGIAVFLASDESCYATGAHFVVDGGRTAR
jgi:NAD(P)-dependent dehydrogenase (short-subunit alcohol dehydrogenase family)